MKWEYRIVFIPPAHLTAKGNVEDWEQKLNALGQEGWELVAVSGQVAYLKRAGS